MNFKPLFTLITLSATSLLPTSAQTLPAKTKWEGMLGKVKIVLHLSEDSITQAKKAEFDIPQNMALGLKVSKLTISNDSLIATSDVLKATFKGAFNQAKTDLNGVWLQNEHSTPLILKQVSTEIRRPQTPKAPFPYTEEKVVYHNKDKSIQYGATLTLPKSSKPVTAVILITGSGPEDRDETIFNHKPFWVIADHLSRNGIAVLRVDDEGVGQTTGSVYATSADFAKDVLTGIDYLKNKAGIDIKNIGLIGHSEGGMIAPMVAAQSNDVAFIITLAGIGIKTSDLMLKQQKDVLKKTGLTDDEIDKALPLFTALASSAVKNIDNTALNEEIKKAYTNWSKQQNEILLKKMGFWGPSAAENINKTVAFFFTPWGRYFLTYDPATTLSKITIPVLALNGEKDMQVEAKPNLAGFKALLTQAGNKNFKTQLMPSLNHLFQHTKTGDVSEYGEIEETISPEVLDIMTTWIKGLKPRK